MLQKPSEAVVTLHVVSQGSVNSDMTQEAELPIQKSFFVLSTRASVCMVMQEILEFQNGTPDSEQQ